MGNTKRRRKKPTTTISQNEVDGQENKL